MAEDPMASARNMLKTLYDRKCGAVVMLSDLNEKGMVRYIYIDGKGSSILHDQYYYYGHKWVLYSFLLSMLSNPLYNISQVY